MATTYVQFKLLRGTATLKVDQRISPPRSMPNYAQEYRYFDLTEEVHDHLANQVLEDDMINPSEWTSCGEITDRP